MQVVSTVLDLRLISVMNAKQDKTSNKTVNLVTGKLDGVTALKDTSNVPTDLVHHAVITVMDVLVMEIMHAMNALTTLQKMITEDVNVLITSTMMQRQPLLLDSVNQPTTETTVELINTTMMENVNFVMNHV
jgi:hypothetical protein